MPLLDGYKHIRMLEASKNMLVQQFGLFIVHKALARLDEEIDEGKYKSDELNHMIKARQYCNLFTN